jgi:hypothetical protein
MGAGALEWHHFSRIAAHSPHHNRVTHGRRVVIPQGSHANDITFGGRVEVFGGGFLPRVFICDAACFGDHRRNKHTRTISIMFA